KIKLVLAEFLRRDFLVSAIGLHGTPCAISHVALNSHDCGKILRLKIISVRRSMEGRVIGVENEAAVRVPYLRNLDERKILVPDQLRPVSGYRFLPVKPGFLLAYRKQPVVDVTDIGLLVGINEIETGN